MMYGYIFFLVQGEKKSIDLSCKGLLENGGTKSQKCFGGILGKLICDNVTR